MFNLHRANVSQHVGFGRGVHFCLSAPMTRLDMRVALEALSARLPSLRLVPDQEWSYKLLLTVRGVEHLLVEWNTHGS